MKKASSFIFLAVFLALAACDNGEVNQSIQRGGDNGNNGSPGNKPEVTLSNRVLLTLSGLAHVEDQIRSALNPESIPACVSQANGQVTWNCREDKKLPAGQRGQATYSKSASGLSISSGRGGVESWIVHKGRLLKGRQHFDLEINGNRLSSSTQIEYSLGTRSNGITYLLEWQTSALLSSDTRLGQTLTLNGVDILLTITKQESKGGKTSPESVFQYRLLAEAPSATDICGRTAGQFLFSGYRQNDLVVVADSESGVKSPKGGPRHLFAACAPHLNGLTMSAPFWARPEP